MTHSRSILVPVLALALLAVPVVPARAAKPQPAPTITAFTMGPARFNLDGIDNAMWAASSDGKIYAAPAPGEDLPFGPFQEVGQVPGRPVSITHERIYVTVCLENGDLYRQARTVELPPYTFTFEENVFTSVGARSAFPDLAPLEDARPILTNEPELDAPGMMR